MPDSPAASPEWTGPSLLRKGWEAHARITYRVVLVTRRRRPAFEGAAVREQVETVLQSSADEMACRVAWCEVAPAIIVAHVEALPTLSPLEVVERLRERVEAELSTEAGEVVFARRHVVTTMESEEKRGARCSMPAR